MYLIMMIFITIFIILLIMIFLLMFLSKKTFMDREKMSPFECGFDPLSSSRIPFSLHFFLIGVLFLIFDIEVIIIFPICLVMKFSYIVNWFFTSFMFVFLIILGLYYEWSSGVLNWT